MMSTETARVMDSGRSRVNLAAASELTIVIVSHEPEFARSLMGSWKSERVVPEFVVLPPQQAPQAGLSGPPAADAAFDPLPECDLVVVGGVPAERLPQLLKMLDPSVRPLICVTAASEYKQVRESFPQLMLLRQDEFWADNVILLAGECMRRRHTVLRAHRAEQMLTANQGHVTLGKYVVEMRHNINNALTSVLGNAELLLLNTEIFSGEACDQLQTIRTTALRLHEIMQRFWSLEAEMRAADRISPETEKVPRAVGASGLK
jgi:signal transduction histidine kinase